MGKHRRTSEDEPLRERATEGSGAAYWSVDDCRWPAFRPTLPAEMVDLLAPPIVVGVARVTATSRLTPPGALATRPAQPGASTLRPAQPGPSTVRPAPPASATSRRPAPVPGPAGRHRGGTAPLDRAG
jgi:hypothetical protein